MAEKAADTLLKSAREQMVKSRIVMNKKELNLMVNYGKTFELSQNVAQFNLIVL